MDCTLPPLSCARACIPWPHRAAASSVGRSVGQASSFLYAPISPDPPPPIPAPQESDLQHEYILIALLSGLGIALLGGLALWGSRYRASRHSRRGDDVDAALEPFLKD